MSGDTTLVLSASMRNDGGSVTVTFTLTTTVNGLPQTTTQTVELPPAPAPASPTATLGLFSIGAATLAGPSAVVWTHRPRR